MIDLIDIMKQIEHIESPEERQKEAFRLIKEREDENMLKHKLFMLKLEETHEIYLTKLRIQIQEIRARTPKRQIYFGKVKTE